MKFLLTFVGIVGGIIGLFLLFCFLYYNLVPGGDSEILRSKEYVLQKF